MIKNVVFDIGIVLVTFRWAELLNDLNLSKEATAEISKHIFEDVWGRLDGEDRTEAEYRKIFEDAVPEYKAEINCVLDHLCEISDEKEYACTWIQAVKEQGYQVYLLSNFGRYPFELLSKKYDFVKLVDGKVISYEVEQMKPDKAIYESLFKKYALNPKECIFVDDRPENIDMAKKLGMQGILFTSYEDASNKLEIALRNNK